MDERDDDSRGPVVNGVNNDYKRGRAGSMVNPDTPTWSAMTSTSTSRGRQNSLSSVAQNTAVGYQQVDMARITKQNELSGRKMALMNRLNALGPSQDQQKQQIQSQITAIDQELSVIASGMSN